MDNYVIDAHIHFEHQPYSIELIENMVEVAKERGIDELHLLDHTHKFSEFNFLYEDCVPVTRAHYEGKKRISIEEYLAFIDEVKARTWPVALRFGLEVCWFPEHEERLREELGKYDFDFLIGSVHHVDGFAFDLGRDDWQGIDLDRIWERYFVAMESLIKSGLFDHLGHADSLKIYGYYPGFDLTPYYERIADLLNEQGMTTENNSGFARYGLDNWGLDKNILEIFRRKGVKLLRSSDAHKYEDIGNKFGELEV